MASKIRVLSDQTIDQIAAGEVVENPASVVKELVENAIDAEATSVKIVIHGGGHYRIAVSDNGSGLSYDDCVLAFERHATSKIASVADLTRLLSMGFRGEALASIAACSKVELTTCERGATLGTQVVVEGGKIKKLKECCRKEGTTIEVSALFYNIPARKAFQKGKGPSTSEIVKMVTRLALAHSTVQFELVSHDEVLLKSEGDPHRVISQMLGDLFAQEMRTINSEEDGWRLEGVVSTPINTRKTRTGQYFFLNRRPIHSPFLSKIIQEAYGTRLSTREYPLAVLWMTLPPHEIDINVHPQKSEVRFANEEAIGAFIRKGINSALGQFHQNLESPRLERPHLERPPLLSKPTFETYTPPLPRLAVCQEPTIHYEVQLTTTIRKEHEMTLLSHFSPFALIRCEEGSPLFEKIEGESCLIFVHLEGVQKRLFFDDCVMRLQKNEVMPTQQLLFPETIEFTRDEISEVEEKFPLLKKMGMVLRLFGPNTVMVESLSEHIPVDRVREIIEQATPNADTTSLAQILLSSFRPEKQLGEREILSLVKRVMQSSDPMHTPNGKRMMKVLTSQQVGEWIASKS